MNRGVSKVKLVEVKCPNCNASLKVDENKKNISCDYCGTNFMLDDNTVHVKHIMAGQITDEQEFINAETNLNKLKDYSASYKGYLSLSKRYVNNEEVWIGLLRSLTCDFSYKYGTLEFRQEYQKYWNNFIALASEEQQQYYFPKYKHYVDTVPSSSVAKGEVKQEKCYVVATILGGWLGIHKFMQNNIGMGIIYFFTFGLFGIGWIIDIIKECKKWPDGKQINIVKYGLMIWCILMALVEIKYTFVSFLCLILAGVSIIDFVWKKLNFTNKVIRIFVPIILFLLGISLGVGSVPESLYGTWVSQSFNNNSVQKIILGESENKIYINGIEFVCLTPDYYKNIIYIETDTSNEYRFQYSEIENNICLLDDNDECQYEYKLERSLTDVENNH